MCRRLASSTCRSISMSSTPSGARRGRARPGRPDLPRGAPRARARRRVGPRRLARGGRGKPHPRPREPHRTTAVSCRQRPRQDDPRPISRGRRSSPRRAAGSQAQQRRRRASGPDVAYPGRLSLVERLERAGEHAGEIARDSPEILEAVALPGQRLRPRVQSSSSPAPTTGSRARSGRRAKKARLVRPGRSIAQLQQDTSDQRCPLVLLRARPDGECDVASGPRTRRVSAKARAGSSTSM